MKAKLMFLNKSWFAIIPPTDSLFPELEVEKNPKKFAVDIYNLKNIITTNWKDNQEIEGNICREKNKIFFVVKNVEYIKCLENEESKTLVLLKGIMGGFNKTPITPEQYDYIHQIAKSENLISSYFSNGYCVNHKYVVYGKLTKTKKVIYPQIKIK